MSKITGTLCDSHPKVSCPASCVDERTKSPFYRFCPFVRMKCSPWTTRCMAHFNHASEMWCKDFANAESFQEPQLRKEGQKRKAVKSTVLTSAPERPYTQNIIVIACGSSTPKRLSYDFDHDKDANNALERILAEQT
ncbi:unnamed protein product [Lepeophtheirus salmonis]|uniref:(salmon louse) hypothetical protein n=1 Tax=Lepeophtheirus salmonis TaxID=72036 RepID=A0A7R8D0T8_LEPSM|nr:unnamed protein product [Lepeophtheirus salmonis]CAF2987626.1 unnamed protein product [Lepeophtheirus salmonis]